MSFMRRVAVWEQEQVGGGQFLHLGLEVHLGASRLLARNGEGGLRVKGKDVGSCSLHIPCGTALGTSSQLPCVGGNGEYQT